MLSRLSTYQFPKEGMLFYYYTASVKNAIDILQYGHLFGSFPSKVNDPDDMRIEVVGLKENHNMPFADRVAVGLQKKADEKKLMDRIYRFVCLADAENVDAHPDVQRYFWVNYADSFKGVRFKFRVDADFLSKPKADETFFDRITYQDGVTAKLYLSDVQNNEDITARIGDEKFLHDLCFVKSTKWAREVEYRLGSLVSRLKLDMSQIQSREERFFLINLKTIQEIVVGPEADNDDKNLLEYYAQKEKFDIKCLTTNFSTTNF